MRNGVQTERLAALRARIAAIEKQPLPDRMSLPAGQGAAPSLMALTRPLPGLLQEIYADRHPDGGAALGFALALVRGLVTPARPAVFFLQPAHAAQETGLPYAPGLAGFGLAPARLVLGRLAHVQELLWAIEEAVACRAVAAVIAELPEGAKTLDFTASRRLSLRAAAGGASVLLLRYGSDRAASAARLRWHIAPALSEAPPFDAHAPGRPRWRATLERSGLPQSVLRGGEELLLDWTENGFTPIRADAAGIPGTARPRHPASSGSSPPLLGNRLAQAG